MRTLYTLPIEGLTRAAGLYPTVILGGILTLILSLWVATAIAAYHWQYAPSLGTPIIGHIYHPWKIILWIFRFHWEPAVVPIFWEAGKGFLWVFVSGMFFTLAAAIRKAKRYGEASDLRGSAALGDTEGMRLAGLLGTSGFLVGGIEK